MPNLPELADDPRTLFWKPGIDDGLYPLADARPYWSVVQGALISSIAISSHRKINIRWHNEDEHLTATRRFITPVQYDSMPVVVENLTVANTYMGVGDRWLLSGTAGERVVGAAERAWRRQGGEKTDWNAKFNDHFAQCRDHGGQPTPWAGPIAGLDFVLEARNLKNYFHFKKELFSNLTLINEIDGFDGQIIIVCEDPHAPGFVLKFLDAVFPELAGRVQFVQGPMHFDRALTVWHGDFAYFQSPTGHIEGLLPPDHEFTGLTLGASMTKVLRHNGYHRSVAKLRERSLGLAAQIDAPPWPDRFWVGRRPTPGHDRSIANEDRIIAELARNGFGVVYFEDLSPLRQIQTMARAKTMASFHGAGFTNLIYAANGAKVVELGTLQTGIQRLGDFSGLAHVSQADYSVVIADFEYDGPRVIPPLRGHGLYPVRISHRGVDHLVEHILDQT